METTFRYRHYTKSELAQLYYPECSPRVAVNRLARWIKDDPQLRAALMEAGYRKTQHDFLSSQVRVLVAFMGEP
jgi:hypothetical protein